MDRTQQNYVVEPKYQHLLNMARVLYFLSRVPLQFWGDCVLTAVYIINRTPSRLLQNQTPYTFLHHKPIDYASFRVFGCVAFASTLPAHRTKFDPHAKPCVFLGYPSSMKAYKFFYINIKQVFISRDVVFHEENFSFSHLICFCFCTRPFS